MKNLFLPKQVDRLALGGCFFGLVFLVLGCATQAKYEAITKSWLGHHTDELISKWGPPTTTTPLSSGGKVIEYSRSRVKHIRERTIHLPMNSYESGTVSAYGAGGYNTINYNGTVTKQVPIRIPPSTEVYWCKTRFTASPKSFIIGWAIEGNSCVAK